MTNEWLWRLLIAMAPSDRAHWIIAMRAEAEALPQESGSLSWLSGAAWNAMKLRWSETGYATEATALAGTMIAVDWISGSALPALVLITATSLLIVSRRPHHVLPATVIAGGTLPIAHAVANLDRALWPHYQFRPLDGRDWMILSLVPLAAYIIAFASTYLRRNATD